MTPEQILDLLEPIVRQYLQGDKPDAEYIVVRAPEGLLILARGGRHVLVQANSASLEVAA
jgi:hypothetical protein